MKASEHGELPAVLPEPRGDTLPLTLDQEAIWLVHRRAPTNSFFNTFTVLRFTGRLDAELATRAVDTIVRRHETLRSSFVDVEGSPRCRVAAARALPMVVEDLRGTAAAVRELECLTRLVADAQRPFDLEEGPLFRLRCLLLADDESWLLLSMHHIVSDTWSLNLIAQEFSVLYEAFFRQTDSPLPPVVVQYGDYAIWQRRALVSGVLAPQLAYWLGVLDGGRLLPCEIPTDYPRPAGASFRTALERLPLSPEIHDKLRKVGRNESCTSFMVYMSLLVVVLRDWTRTTDVRVGTLVAVRNQPCLEDVIGLLVNTLLLRFDLAGHATWPEALATVRQTMLDAYDHQELPFETLVRALESQRTCPRSSLFRIMVLFKPAPSKPLDMPFSGATVEVLDIDKEMLDNSVDVGRTVTSFDLIFTFVEKTVGLDVCLTYKTDLFSPATARVLLENLRAAATEMVSIGANRWERRSTRV